MVASYITKRVTCMTNAMHVNCQDMKMSQTSPYDDVSRHPTIGEALTDFDRNVRIALSMDGFIPFGLCYSLWPLANCCDSIQRTPFNVLAKGI
ncbi:hypothetical protein OSB04_002474 [Centaurea solstitialis]|uniref:Uncharacterized protein n=1 Tax=Centaurea solstitialis TaxID=347529 RepID=A0AA38U0K3_9ASTR|nr:hypothetical protein OSB04_002474 [Centaurea solstitialis]